MLDTQRGIRSFFDFVSMWPICAPYNFYRIYMGTFEWVMLIDIMMLYSAFGIFCMAALMFVSVVHNITYQSSQVLKLKLSRVIKTNDDDGM